MFEPIVANRRAFLTKCSALALAGGLAPGRLFGNQARLDLVSLDKISFAQFAAQLGSEFRVELFPGASLSMVLVEATRRKLSHPMALRGEDAQNEHFSLVYQGPGDVPLTQDTYAFAHAALGQFPMFIVPIHSLSGEQRYYEAIFNRLPVWRGPRSF
jgi:hypothetical protein